LGDVYDGAPGEGTDASDTGIDLQLVPSRIIRVGRMSMTFTKTSGIGPGNRPKGHLTAYVPVSWYSKEAGAWVPRSSVFMAHAWDSDDPFAPLIFRDVNGMSGLNDFWSKWRYCSTWENFFMLPLPKLPRSQQRDAHHAFHPSTAQNLCPYQVDAVAAAPSDPRIVYALLTPRHRDNPVGCPKPTSYACQDDAKQPILCTPQCDEMAGIYQSLDRGLTWSLVLSPRSYHAPNGINGMGPVTPWRDIVVSAKNPYVAWFSGVEDGWYRLQPVKALPNPPANITDFAGVMASLPKPSGCQACNNNCAPTVSCHPFTAPGPKGQALDNNQLFNADASKCDKLTIMPDPCGLFAEFNGNNPSGFEPTPSPPATSLGACVQPAGSFLSVPAGWTNAGGTANLGVPPACTYHPASDPLTPTSLIAPCVDCLATTNGTSWASCNAAVPVVPTATPPRCCMGAVPMSTLRTAKQCVDNVQEPTLSQNTGVSEEAVFHATTLATKSTLDGPLVESVLIGSKDSGAQAGQAQSAASIASWQAMGFKQMTWFSAVAATPPSTATAVPTPAPNTVFEFVLPAKTVLTGSPATATAWALASQANCEKANDSLLDLVQLTISGANQIKATILGSVAKGTFPGAPWADCNPTTLELKEKTLPPSRQSLLRHQLLADDQFAYVSGSGLGVVAIHLAQAKNSNNGMALVPGRQPLLWPGQSSLELGPGPAVHGIALAKGWLWAVVGACQKPTSQTVGYAPSCSPTAPGLWIHPTVTADPAWATKPWVQVIPAPPFGDPYSLVIRTVKATGSSKSEPVLFLGNWTALPDCMGGLYALPLAGVEPVAINTQSLTWRLLVRQDGVASVDVDPLLNGKASTTVYMGITGDRYSNQKPQDVAAGALPGSGWSASTGMAPGARPGVYAFEVTNIHTAGAGITIPASGSSSWSCAAMPQTAPAAQLFDCSATSSSPACVAVDGATGVPKPLVGSMSPTTGLGNANLSTYRLDSSRIHYGKLVVATVFGGAFTRLLETNVPKVLSTDALANGASGNGGLGILVQQVFDPESDWRIRFVEATLRYDFQHDGPDWSGSIKANDVSLDCATGLPCLPGHARQGLTWPQMFDLPASTRTLADVFFLWSGNGPIQPHQATVVVDRAGLQALAVPIQPNGSRWKFYAQSDMARTGRLRLSYQGVDPNAGMGKIWLNGSAHPPIQLFGPDGLTHHVVLTGLRVRAGWNDLWVADLQDTQLLPLDFEAVDFAEGAVADAEFAVPDAPTSQATHFLASEPRMLRRSAVWLVLKLEDGAHITYVRLNNGPQMLVQDQTWLDGPHPAPTPSMVRIAVNPALVRTDINQVHVSTAVCDAQTTSGSGCLMNANVLDATLVFDVADDPSYCLPAPEVCGDGKDNDCNGSTDDVAPGLCDGADLDGCRLGHQPCTGGACKEQSAYVPPHLTPSPTQLTCSVTSADLVFASGATVEYPGNVAGQTDLLSLLDQGVAFTVPAGVTPGDTLLALKFTFGRSGCVTSWNRQLRQVEIGSQPTDPNGELFWTLTNPIATAPGSIVSLVGDPATVPALVDRFFGCPDGTVTYPGEMPVHAF